VIAGNITYDWGRMRANSPRHWGSFEEWWQPGIKYPMQTYYDKKGVCIIPFEKQFLAM